MVTVSLSIHFFTLPAEIRMIAGKSHEFEFNLPLEAKIMAEKQGVLKVNHQPVTENIHINLRKPFHIESSEIGTLNVQLQLFGVIPLKKLKVDIIPDMMMIPSGKTVAVRIQTDGIMVLGTGVVTGVDGDIHEPSKGLLQSGDLIMSVNGNQVLTAQELVENIADLGEKPIQLQIKREEETLETWVQPVKNKDEQTYKLGIWVRDSTQGIGTLTYINPETMTYGALGHGITDVDTKQLMPIRKGNIMKTEITTIRKGEKGAPGELSGAIVETADTIIGSVDVNTSQGVFGKINREQQKDDLLKDAIPIALQHDVEEGPAIIRSNISGDIVEEFTIEIQKITRYNDQTAKGMIIKITDPRLLDQTNGIVQGMSGSPIIQNGKLIGAVTHVFVQEPSKGYGIFIENMLKKEKDMVNNGKVTSE